MTDRYGFQYRQVSGPRIKNDSVNQHNNYGGAAATVGVVVDILDCQHNPWDTRKGLMLGVVLTSETFRSFEEADAHVEPMLLRFGSFEAIG